MDHSFWAGVAAVETASQLAFGVILVIGYWGAARLATRDRNWPVYSVACLASASLSASTFGLLRVGGASFGVVSALFAVSITALVLSLSLSSLFVADLSQRVRRASLVGSLVFIVGLVYWRFPPLYWVKRANVNNVLSLEFTSSGRALVVVLIVLLLGGMIIVRRRPRLERSEQIGLQIGFCIVTVMLLLDGAGVSARVSPVPFAVHVGIPWCLMLWAFSLLSRNQLSQRYEQVVLELTTNQRELSRSQAHLEQMRCELGTKKQLAVVGELAASIAHEVRNPLAIIVNAAAGLRRPSLQVEDRNTLLGILDEETARLNRLVTDLLRFARPVIVKRTSVSIIELVKRVQGRLEDNQVLAVSVPEDPLLRTVQADANLLRLVFDNLVANAYQAMPDGGTVQIVVSAETVGDEPFVRIDIVDHGQGMDEQVRVRATDPFYTTRPSGTGLGLPIVQRIVEAHGGTVNIDSAPGQGTTVSLLLPRLLSADNGDSDGGNRG